MNHLEALANNPAQLEALRAHLLSKFDSPVAVEGKDDNLLGQIFRARLTGRELVEEAFRDIERLRTPGVIVLALVAGAFFLGSKKEARLGSAPSGVPGTVATTSVSLFAAGGTNILVGTTTGSGCSSRVISTTAGYVMLTFSDIAGQVPSGAFGLLQAASTTVAYDSGIYGCGLLRAYSPVVQTVTVMRVN